MTKELLTAAKKALEVWDDLYSNMCKAEGDEKEIAVFDDLRAAITEAEAVT